MSDQIDGHSAAEKIEAITSELASRLLDAGRSSEAGSVLQKASYLTSSLRRLSPTPPVRSQSAT